MIKTFSYSIHELKPYINWLYFFYAWQMPANLVDEIVGGNSLSKQPVQTPQSEEMRLLYSDALAMLDEFDCKYKTHGRVGLFGANSDNDNLIIHTPGQQVLFPCLRQQTSINGQPQLCLADFIKPVEMGEEDTLGVFTATVDIQMEQEFPDDKYAHLLAQTLSDRLAEATIELMHQYVRTSMWGYAEDEHLPIQELFSEHFQGIRPAVGYPSLPDQSVNFIINDLINMEGLGIHLTENGAMLPHASVSGLMFAHPQAHYFCVGKIGEDQLIDYACRRNLPINKLRQFLSSNL